MDYDKTEIAAIAQRYKASPVKQGLMRLSSRKRTLSGLQHHDEGIEPLREYRRQIHPCLLDLSGVQEVEVGNVRVIAHDGAQAKVALRGFSFFESGCTA